MLVHRAVRRGEIALVAAGGDHKGIRQAQGADIALAVGGILNGHRPGLVLGVGAVDVHVTAQIGAAAGEGAAVEQDGGAVGGVALGDAAQIDGAALIQRDAAKFGLVDVLIAHQRQQCVDLRLRGDAGTVGGDAPQFHQRGDGDIEGTVRFLAVLQRPRQQLRTVLVPDGGAVTVQTGDLAGVHRAGEGGFQRVDGAAQVSQHIISAVADGHEGHVGVHGEELQRLTLLCAAGGERQGHQRGQDKAGKSFHSSRRPSSARMSVASSANSRWPPTGIP